MAHVYFMKQVHVFLPNCPHLPYHPFSESSGSSLLLAFLLHLMTDVNPTLRELYGDDGSRPRRSRYEAELSEIEHEDDEENLDYMDDDGSEGRPFQWGDPGYEEGYEDHSESERSDDDDDMYY